jgi:hypothetical protein
MTPPDQAEIDEARRAVERLIETPKGRQALLALDKRFDAAKRDDAGDDMVPADDPRVLEVRRLLAKHEAWRRRSEKRNDLAAVAEDAAPIVAGLCAFLIESGLSSSVHARVVAEGLEADPDWTAKARVGFRALAGGARVLVDLGPALMPPADAMRLAGDLFLMSSGDPPLLNEEIPHGGRASRAELLRLAKAQVSRLAYFEAGRKGTNWRTEHAAIYPGLGDEGRKDWNRELSRGERRACRRVGALMARGEPLTPSDELVRAQATRVTPERLRALIVALH